VAVFPTARDRITAGDLDGASVRFGHALDGEGVQPGDIVGILVPPASRLLTALFGVWRTGAAVSVLPVHAGFGGDDATARRLARIIDAVGMRHLVLDQHYGAIGHALRALTPTLSIVDPAAALPGSPRALPAVEPDSLAVVQFTSGSTGTPKGVMLTHRTAMAGLRASVISGEFSPDDVFVQWVPHFHDMGLIGLLSHWLNGADVHAFAPATFLRRPLQVLEYFAQHRGTVITGPNFSYDYLLDATTPEHLATLDLSSWRLAFNGSEPVSAATVDRFTRALAPAGVAESVMYPVYGMAEATLSISYPLVGSTPRVVHVDRDRLGADATVREVSADSPTAKPVVCVGRPVHDLRLRIVSADGGVAGPGRLGEVQIAGPAMTSGYFRLPEETARLFDGEWMRTGDLGFQLGPDLFVAGRSKEMVIVRGQNFFPDDVEALAREVPGVFRGRCVAFSDLDVNGAEHVGVIVEADGRAATIDQVRDRVLSRVRDELGLAQVRVYVVRPRWLTRTTSGKWQRTLASQRLVAEAGTLPRSGQEGHPR
jgi:acyl-CoA synthetase (AMP-forming)/AMP-acid ligase II